MKPKDERKILEIAASWDKSGVASMESSLVHHRTIYELVLVANNAPTLKTLLEKGWRLSASELYCSHQYDGSDEIIYLVFQARSSEEIESMLDLLLSNGVNTNRKINRNMNCLGWPIWNGMRSA